MAQDPFQLRRVTPQPQTGAPAVLAPPAVDDPFQLRSVNTPLPQIVEPSTLDTVLDYVSAPGRMTMGAIRAAQDGTPILERALANRPANLGGTREDDFDDVLAEAGLEDTALRRALGFVGTVAIDPLNLVPVAPIAKGIGAATGLTKLVGKVGAAAKTLPFVEDIGQRFIPHYGLDKFVTKIDTPMGPETKTFQDLSRLHDSKLAHVREQAGQEALDMFEGLTNDEAFTMAKALDTGTALADPRLEGMRLKAVQRFEEQFTRESAAGMLPAGSKQADYMPHILVKDPIVREMRARALTAKNPFQLRKELSLEEGVAKGVFEPDVRRGMATRIATGERALANQEFFQQTAKEFGTKIGPNDVMPDAHRLVQLSADAPLKASLEGVALPNEIANSIEKMLTIPAAPKTLDKLANGFTALWKGYATRANPGFHMRNGVSNMLQTWMGGLGDSKVLVLNPIVLLSKHYKAGKMLANRANLPARIGKYTASDINKALDDYGVIGGAHTSFNELDDIIEAEVKHAGKSVVGRNLNLFDKRNALLRGGAKVGNAVENTSRMALFIDQLEKGHSLEDAALHVRKYLFDYSELTDFEKGICDKALPFYTWLRKNIPLQVDNVLTQPHKVAVFGKGQDAIEDVSSDRGTEVSANARPEWMRDYIQLPQVNESGDPVFVSPSLPIQDLNKLQPDFKKDVLSALNPIPRMALELGTNEVFFTGRPVYNPDLPGGGLKPANPLAQLAYKGLPQAASDALGIVETNRGVEMPALMDYPMRQLPIQPNIGRGMALLTDDTEDTPDDLPGGLDPNVLSLLGLPTRVLTPEQQAMARKLKADGLKAAIAAQRREFRRRNSGSQ